MVIPVLIMLFTEMGFLPTDNEPTNMVIGGLIVAIIMLGLTVFFVINFVSTLH